MRQIFKIQNYITANDVLILQLVLIHYYQTFVLLSFENISQ